MWSPWGTISQHHEGCECHPILTLVCSICKAECLRRSVQVYTTNILYIFTWMLFVCFYSIWTFQNIHEAKTKVVACLSWEQVSLWEVSELSVAALGVVRCPLSVHCRCLVSCLPQALRHKDEWQGQICHSADTATTGHSNGASGKRKMTQRAFDRRSATVLRNSCGWSSVRFVYHHWRLYK